MQITINLLLLLLSFSCFGQDSLFFDKKWKSTISSNAEFFRIENKEGSKWLRSDYFKTKQLQMKETYSSVNPEKEVRRFMNN